MEAHQYQDNNLQEPEGGAGGPGHNEGGTTSRGSLNVPDSENTILESYTATTTPKHEKMAHPFLGGNNASFREPSSMSSSTFHSSRNTVGRDEQLHQLRKNLLSEAHHQSLLREQQAQAQAQAQAQQQQQQSNQPASKSHHHRHHHHHHHHHDSVPNPNGNPCKDCCPDQDVYTESNFFRFTKGARTNIYGMVAIGELANEPYTNGTPGAGGESNQVSRFAATRPRRYVMVASGSNVTCFLGMSETLELTIGSANQEIISIDAFERTYKDGYQVVLIAALAKAENPTQFELRILGTKTYANTVREHIMTLQNTTDTQILPLTWAPTKITHIPLNEDPSEMSILVGGSDSCVHFFIQGNIKDQGVQGQDQPTEPSTTNKTANITALKTADTAPLDPSPLTLPGPADEDEDAMDKAHLYSEKPIQPHFPVLASFDYCEHCVLALEIRDFPTCRVIAAGTQNGTLNVGIIPRDTATSVLDRSRTVYHTIVLFSPITTLGIYTTEVQSKVGKQRRQQAQKETVGENEEVKENQKEAEEEGNIHLLVTCAIEQAWVYRSINKNGLQDRSELQECSHHDSILAAHVMDANWDGQNELLIGTYGRQLMVFQEHGLNRENRQSHHNHHHHHHQERQPCNQSEIVQDGDSVPNTRMEANNNPNINISHYGAAKIEPEHANNDSNIGIASATKFEPHPTRYSMTWNRRFAWPVYSISSADLNDDGLEEIIVTTLYGVSIFLPDPDMAKRHLKRSMVQRRDIELMKAKLERLRIENEILEREAEVKKLEKIAEEERRKEQEELDRLAKIQREKEEQLAQEQRRIEAEKEEEERERLAYEEVKRQREEQRLQKEKEEKEREEAKELAEKLWREEWSKKEGEDATETVANTDNVKEESQEEQENVYEQSESAESSLVIQLAKVGEMNVDEDEPSVANEFQEESLPTSKDASLVGSTLEEPAEEHTAPEKNQT